MDKDGTDAYSHRICTVVHNLKFLVTVAGDFCAWFAFFRGVLYFSGGFIVSPVDVVSLKLLVVQIDTNSAVMFVSIYLYLVF